MDLAPVKATRLRGRTAKRRTTLVVADADGRMVVAATLGKAVDFGYAIFETSTGRWRVRDGAKTSQGVESAAVVDTTNGKLVATLRPGEIVLAGGETLPWVLSSLFRGRCRIGGDLWVATRGTLRTRRFKVRLSAAMLERADLGFLVGLASILTVAAQTSRDSLMSAGSAGSAFGGI